MKKSIEKTKIPGSIPPPPELEDGYDAIIEYHKKYSVDELLKAGHLEEVPEEEQREVQTAATYQLLCSRGLHLKLSRRDYQSLAELAVCKKVDVEDLVKQWIMQHLRGSSPISRNGKR